METLENSELCFPHLLNASCRRPKRSHSEAILIYVLLSSLSLLTVFLNLLVIISISHFRQLQTPTNTLLLSLAVSDFLVGFLMCFQIMLIDGCWLLGDGVCVVYQYLSYIITSSSIGTMVLISVDRYVAICEPMFYSTKITHRRIKVCVALSWFCSSSFQSLNLSDNLQHPGRYNTCLGECIIVINYIAGLADLILTFVGPITVIIVLYTRVFVVAVSHARAMRSQIAAVTLVTVKKSEIKAARTLGVVIVVFLFCVCPFFCVTLVGEQTVLNASSSAFVICLFYLNSCLNPVIYAFFYPWFRKSVKVIVTLKLLQRDSCEANML
ncbi:trace amine-associated receptor 13c-like [Solea senegalensis]|uniref:Trace amine-associated receptor 13c-like n=1 Tax=Solea senegalensis TaxID=28829 RepID=A0AAV6RAM7_SOLSE|nr:trace amine-associated receptor 13c-like [Solea senegalensis]KAG7501664.1 trace amine-associated receptor 13c-like [Solea senegalensis]